MVKGQRKVNQWKQYCDYREGLHGSSDWGGEGSMTLSLIMSLLCSEFFKSFLLPTGESANLLALPCTRHLNSLISYLHPPPGLIELLEFCCSHPSPFAYTVSFIPHICPFFPPLQEPLFTLYDLIKCHTSAHLFSNAPAIQGADIY